MVQITKHAFGRSYHIVKSKSLCHNCNNKFSVLLRLFVWKNNFWWNDIFIVYAVCRCAFQNIPKCKIQKILGCCKSSAAYTLYNGVFGIFAPLWGGICPCMYIQIFFNLTLFRTLCSTRPCSETLWKTSWRCKNLVTLTTGYHGYLPLSQRPFYCRMGCKQREYLGMKINKIKS